MVNKFRGLCEACGGNVPVNGGQVVRRGRRWVVYHIACERTRAPEVVTYRFSSGETMTQNKRGRCIDAPCCGCCSA